eukprot:CAMPEP_0206578258 /NCGR_PEP_ID=MMETSP0325_2-20121206/31857_1 /ASSEMBLY_ACC=CAM_ASM_000347 /TAXON_ID=2866 /ORGANISM="Crypthecodinium cohnii, Strain Seligo" /LENGTH=83 /DNA_ID=CAMNT_0054083865 /DNA_START=889 /DNA_END=1137 /DNA_ORIENTATION=+
MQGYYNCNDDPPQGLSPTGYPGTLPGSYPFNNTGSRMQYGDHMQASQEYQTSGGMHPLPVPGSMYNSGNGNGIASNSNNNNNS